MSSSSTSESESLEDESSSFDERLELEAFRILVERVRDLLWFSLLVFLLLDGDRFDALDRRTGDEPSPRNPGRIVANIPPAQMLYRVT